MKLGKNVYVLIMAGGSGKRLWPLSQETCPKQFIDLLGGGESMLQLTYNRFLNWVPKENIFIVSHQKFGEIISDQLPAVSSDNILLVPCDHNTGPAIAYASHRIYSLNPEGLVIVSPSDHIILKDVECFKSLHVAVDFAFTHDALVTLGITPLRADTGYGYIKCAKHSDDEVCEVVSFVEKPVYEVAQSYLMQKNYLWNSGIFIWNLNAIIGAIKRCVPEWHDLFSNGANFYNTSNENLFVRKAYPESIKLSIEHGVLEKAGNVFTLRADIGWSDLGSWESLHFISDKDERNNVIKADGSRISDVDGSIICIPHGNRAIIKGLKDFVVVQNGIDLLIYPRMESNDIY